MQTGRGEQQAGEDGLTPRRRPSRRVRAFRRTEGGFTLAALVVTMAVMAIFLTVAVETVSFQQKREKEDELIFRGGQAVEAIRLFKARFGRYPIKLDELATAKPRVLRRVWTDPMTGKADWVPVLLGEDGTTVNRTPIPGATPQPTAQPTPQSSDDDSSGASSGSTPHAGSSKDTRGPIIGVKSRVCEGSIKLYLGHTNYCEWKFFYDPSTLQLPANPGAVTTPKP